MALPEIQSRPYDALELKKLYDTGGALEGSDDYEAADLTTAKTDLGDDIAARIQTIQTANAAETDPAVWVAALETLKSQVVTDINSNINDSYTVSKAAVLQEIKEDYVTLAQTDGDTPLTYPCPECAEQGLKPVLDANGDVVPDTYERSALCDGYGYTQVQKKVNRGGSNLYRCVMAKSDKTDTLKKKVLDALAKCRGLVTDACKIADISRQTHYQWLKDDPDYKLQVEAIEDEVLDFAENKLFSLIAGGDTTATIFFLKTKGKRRGYVEKKEITGADGQPLIPTDSKHTVVFEDYKG